MKSSVEPNRSRAGDENATGLPLLRTWPAVYWFVLVVFALYVVLLTALSRVFS
jgi:hypothetical protein